MKKLCKILALSALCLTLGAGSAVAAPRDTLVVGNVGLAGTMDPHATISGAALVVIRHVHEGLVGSRNGKIVPLLAESWRILDDKVSYEFKIKQGVKFHNGETMTIDDVVFSFERALSPAGSRVRSFSKNLIAVKKVDDRTVVLKTDIPLGENFVASLTHTWASVFSKKAVESAGLDYGQKIVGTGQFMLSRFVPNNRAEMTRFEDYHGKKARLKGLTFRAINDATSRTIELESGAVQAILDLAPVNISRIKDNPKLEIVAVDSYRTFFLGLDMSMEPYTNPKVREAMNLAMNRAGMVKALYRGYAKPGRGATPATVAFSRYDQSPDFPYDPAKAKKLLAEAGYPKGFKGTITTPERSDYQALAQVSQSNLRDIGIEMEIRVMEFGAFEATTTQPKHGSYIHNWGANMPTSDSFFALNPFYHSKTIGSSNRSMYNSPKADELMDKGAQSTDEKERAAIYKELWDLLNKDLPQLILLSAMNVNGKAKNLKGVEFSPSLTTNYFGDAYFE